MPAAIAEPPVKPTPTPSPAPKPTPSPSPKTEIKAAPVETVADDDPWQGLDEQIAGKKPEVKPEVKPEAKQPEKEPEAKPEAKSTTEIKPGAKPAPSENKQLREQYERTKAELEAKNEAVAKYEARIAEFEAKGKDTTALAEKLSQVEKERDEAKAEARAAKAEMSDEFKSKWDKPFERQAELARKVISRLAVGKVATDEATGESAWKAERQAVWETDFPKLYQEYAADPVGTEEKVTEKFGKGGRIVMGHIESLYRLDQEREAAKVEEKAQWKEKDTAERAKAVQAEIEQQKQEKEQREAYEAGLNKARAGFIEKNPEWYDEDPEDPEGNKILQEGRRMMTEQPKTFEQAVILNTRNRLNAESAPRERYRNRLLRDKIAELEAKLAEFKETKPGPGKKSSTGETKPVETEDSFDGLEEAFNK